MFLPRLLPSSPHPLSSVSTESPLLFSPTPPPPRWYAKHSPASRASTLTTYQSEYIGSRISLISKSDIKYIGTLHEINSDTHTVALESVTSYGTEGRKGNPAEEISGSDQVYEYIVFRGSDVKELTIVAPPSTKENQAPPKMPDDPAILAVSILRHNNNPSAITQ